MPVRSPFFFSTSRTGWDGIIHVLAAPIRSCVYDIEGTWDVLVSAGNRNLLMMKIIQRVVAKQREPSNNGQDALRICYLIVGSLSIFGVLES